MLDGFKDDDRTESHIFLTKGTFVHHYRIIKKIGLGGMGEVYLAEDTELKRNVALKFLVYHLCQNREFRSRFKREARAAAKLNHPNLITIHEVGEFRDQPFLAMQYIKGRSLRDVIIDGELSLKSIINLSIQICQGLSKAHETGIIHRDIKPSNILIDDDNRPKILDFGLATFKGTNKLTKTGSTLGTVAYMSPEQVRGEELDVRTDLFSFGVVLYEMLTGKAPYKNQNEAATYNAILNESPEPLQKFKKDIPNELSSIVNKALDKDRNTRYQSAEEILTDLRHFIENTDLKKSPVASPKKKIKTSKKLLIPGLISVFVLIILVLKPWILEFSLTKEAIAEENRLIIMPFVNYANPDDVNKGRIVANLLINDLSKSDYLKITSWNGLLELMNSRGIPDDSSLASSMALQLARDSRSKWMIEGGIVQEAPFVLTANLVDISSGDVYKSRRIYGDSDQPITILIDSLTIGIKKDLLLPGKAYDEPDPMLIDVTYKNPQAYNYFIEGVENALAVTETGDAVKNLRMAIELDSTFAMAYFALAFVDFTLMHGDTSKVEAEWAISQAVKHIDNVSKKEKLIIDALQYYLLDNDYFKASEKLSKLEEEFPNDKLSLAILEFYYYQIKEYELAAEFGERLINVDPYFGVGYNCLTYIYMALENYEKALYSSQKYKELEPDNAKAYDARGDLYTAMDENIKAIESYKKAIDLKPDLYAIYIKLASAYIIARHYEDADSILRKIYVSPSMELRAMARSGLGSLYMYQGRFNEAISYLDTAMAGDKMENIEIDSWYYFFKVTNKCYSYIMLRQPNSATLTFANYKNDIKASGSSIPPWTYISYIVLLAEAGDYVEAEKQMTAISELIEEPHMKQYWKNAIKPYVDGILEYQKGNNENAARLLENAFEKDSPEFFEMWCAIWLGRVYLSTGQYEEAIETLEYNTEYLDLASLKSSPIVSAISHYLLGKAYEMAGLRLKAIENYDILLEDWKNADEEVIEVQDARERLNRLKSNI